MTEQLNRTELNGVPLAACPVSLMPICRVTLKGLELLEVLPDEGDDVIHGGTMGDLTSLTRD